MPCLQSAAGKRAFTLIEMLVVIAIIAILAGMLMPSLMRARDSSRGAVCASQERQMGVANNMYMGDNAGRLPMDCRQWYWKRMIGGYADSWLDQADAIGSRNAAFYLCPMDTLSMGERADGGNKFWCYATPSSGAWFALSYGINVRISGYSTTPASWDFPNTLNKIRYPTKVFLFSDSIQRDISQNTSANFPHNDNMANAVYVDGHVGTVFEFDFVAFNGTSPNYQIFWSGRGN